MAKTIDPVPAQFEGPEERRGKTQGTNEKPRTTYEPLGCIGDSVGVPHLYYEQRKMAIDCHPP